VPERCRYFTSYRVILFVERVARFFLDVDILRTSSRAVFHFSRRACQRRCDAIDYDARVSPRSDLLLMFLFDAWHMRCGKDALCSRRVFSLHERNMPRAEEFVADRFNMRHYLDYSFLFFIYIR